MITNEQLLSAKILIADDQRLHSLYLEKLLLQEGYTQIQCVNEPIKILSAAREFHPDLIILDLIMPQLDGFQILEQFHEYRRDHYLPILALTEASSSDVRLRALQAGATDVLAKPYENIEILSRIRNTIEMRVMHIQLEDQNKILELRVGERTKELRETQLDIIRRLAQAAEFRDNDTGLHIVRMSQYCAKLGESLGMTDAEREVLLNASPLHDVGKIGIPDSILLKPGKLTEDEFEIMKQHTTIGAQLLQGSDAPLMKMARLIALTHHEKWDGSGYPQGMKEDEIPMVGQICSICDVFDALTSERPYKKAWTVDEAMEEIESQADRHFQKKLVDRFVEIRAEIEAIKTRHDEGREGH